MIVNSSLDEVKKRENALSIIKDIVENKGREFLFDLTGLSGGFIASPSELSLLETYVGPAIFEDALQEVGIAHMGGEKVLPLNRTSSGILATILTLVEKDSNVVHYLAKLPAHPSIPRSCRLVGANYSETDVFEDFSTPDNTSLVVITGSTMDHQVIDEDEFKHGKVDDLAGKLYDKALESYNRKMQLVGEKTLPVIKDIYEKQPGLKYILIPFTDGKKGINVSVNIEKAVQNGAHEISLALEKFITLAMIDDAWVEHLREIDDLKQAVQNSAHYEQKDPLVIYKMESYNLFENMILKMNSDVISFLMLSNLPAPDPSNARAQRARAVDRTKLKEQRSDLLSKANTNTQENQVTQPIHVEKKVGRNDPCPCGSGKKYKNCHGRLE